jgi:hypothetical protein
VSAVSTRKSVEGSEGRMGRCGEAVVLDLNGGVGHGRALPSGGAQSKLERGKAWEGGVVFQRGLGVLYRAGLVHGGRGSHGGVHGARR